MFATAASFYYGFGEARLGVSAGAALAGITAVTEQFGTSALTQGCLSAVSAMSQGQIANEQQMIHTLEDWEQSCDLGPCGPMPVQREPGFGVSPDMLYGYMLDNSGWRDSYALANQMQFHDKTQ